MTASTQQLLPLLACVAALLMIRCGVAKRRIALRWADRRCPTCRRKIGHTRCGWCEGTQ